MITKLNLSFKKGSSRPVRVDPLRDRTIMITHWIEFANLWSDSKLFINVDEVLISNKTKLHYSWMTRGQSWKIENNVWGRSKSLIVAVTSNGELFYSFIESTYKSDSFISFMKKLLLWVENDLDHRLKDTIILLDNWKVHKSKSTTDFLLNNNATYVFIPPYSPEIAPIELIFGVMKRWLLIQIPKIGIKLNKRSGEREIREAFATISKNEIIGSFNHWFKIILQYLHKFMQ